jgi:hypothetical protein
MRYVTEPNLPEGNVCLALADGRISAEAENNLKKLGAEIIRIKPHPGLYEAVCSHPDMLFHHAGGRLVIYAPGADSEAVSELESRGFQMVMGESRLRPEYPGDIAYNAARVGKWYFHNLRYTDSRIKEAMERMGIEPVHVAQGYAKCSVLPVDASSVVTSDKGIAAAARKKGLDVLCLECGDSICLPGLDYGFIGGACGMLSESVCAINGSLAKLKDFNSFLSFLTERKISVVELSKDRVTDIGSILPLMISDHGN